MSSLLGSCLLFSEKKKASMAGYYNSSIISYQFEMYPDSTFCLRTIGTQCGTWKIKEDTFFLFEREDNNQIVGKIHQGKCLYGISMYQILKEMDLKTFNPPKVIVYPKPR